MEDVANVDPPPVQSLLPSLIEHLKQIRDVILDESMTRTYLGTMSTLVDQLIGPFSRPSASAPAMNAEDLETADMVLRVMELTLIKCPRVVLVSPDSTSLFEERDPAVDESSAGTFPGVPLAFPLWLLSHIAAVIKFASPSLGAEGAYGSLRDTAARVLAAFLKTSFSMAANPACPPALVILHDIGAVLDASIATLDARTSHVQIVLSFDENSRPQALPLDQWSKFANASELVAFVGVLLRALAFLVSDISRVASSDTVYVDSTIKLAASITLAVLDSGAVLRFPMLLSDLNCLIERIIDPLVAAVELPELVSMMMEIAFSIISEPEPTKSLFSMSESVACSLSQQLSALRSIPTDDYCSALKLVFISPGLCKFESLAVVVIDASCILGDAFRQEVVLAESLVTFLRHERFRESAVNAAIAALGDDAENTRGGRKRGLMTARNTDESTYKRHRLDAHGTFVARPSHLGCTFTRAPEYDPLAIFSLAPTCALMTAMVGALKETVPCDSNELINADTLQTLTWMSRSLRDTEHPLTQSVRSFAHFVVSQLLPLIFTAFASGFASGFEDPAQLYHLSVGLVKATCWHGCDRRCQDSAVSILLLPWLELYQVLTDSHQRLPLDVHDAIMDFGTLPIVKSCPTIASNVHELLACNKGAILPQFGSSSFTRPRLWILYIMKSELKTPNNVAASLVVLVSLPIIVNAWKVDDESRDSLMKAVSLCLQRDDSLVSPAFESYGRIVCSASGLGYMRLDGSFSCRRCDDPIDDNLAADSLVNIELQDMIALFARAISKDAQAAAMDCLNRFLAHTTLPKYSIANYPDLVACILACLPNQLANKAIRSFCRGSVLNAEHFIVLAGERVLGEKRDIGFGLFRTIICDSLPASALSLLLRTVINAFLLGDGTVGGQCHKLVMCMEQTTGLNASDLIRRYGGSDLASLLVLSNSDIELVHRSLLPLGISTKDVALENIGIVLSQLIQDENIAVIQGLSQLLETPIAELCLRYMSDILWILFKVEDSAAFDRALTNLDGLSQCDRNDAVSAYRNRLLIRFVFDLGAAGEAEKSRIFLALARLASEPSHLSSASYHSSRAAVSSLLSERLVYIMTKANELLSSEQRLHAKPSLLASVSEIIYCCRDSLAVIVRPLIAFLATAAEISDMRPATISLARDYCRSIAWSDVQEAIPELVAFLIEQTYYCVDSDTDLVADILYTIFDWVAEHRVDCIHSFIGWPIKPSMDRIRKRVLHWMSPSRPWQEQLMPIVPMLSSKKSSILFLALQELRCVLQSQQSAIWDAILASSDSSIDPVIRSLMQIIASSRGAVDKYTRLAADCLGILGAVDPGRIQSERLASQPDVFEFDESTHVVAFASHILRSYLIPAYNLSENSEVQAFAAFAIQELLKIDGLVTRRDSERKVEFIGEFGSLSTALMPFTSSKYSVLVHSAPLKSGEVFLTTSTFQEWVGEWARLLVQPLNDNAGRILHACLPLIRSGNAIGNFALLHTLLHAIISGTDLDRKNIVDEIKAILSLHRHAFLDERLALASQTVFEAMDFLNLWMRVHRRKKAPPSTRSRATLVQERDVGQDLRLLRLERFFSMIPRDDMVLAALNCGAEARAAMLLEQIAHESTSQRDGRLESLLGVYRRMNEVDCVSGVFFCLPSPSITQNIALYEARGDWTEAQTSYEVLLSADPSLSNAKLGLLRSMIHSGHYGSALAFIKSANDQSASEYNESAAEACRNLGRWKDLDAITRSSDRIGFETSLGRLLVCISENDSRNAQVHLEAARDVVIQRMSAAAAESYQRAYEYVRQLHMLNEADQFIRLSDRDPSLFSETWMKRLRIADSLFDTQQAILRFRLQLLRFVAKRSVTSEMTKTWLALAQLARKEGRLHIAHSAVLEASCVGSAPAVVVEEAKLAKMKGSDQFAVRRLENLISSVSEATVRPMDTDASTTPEHSSVVFKARLNLARWSEELNLLGTNVLMNAYNQLSKDYPTNEKAVFYYAQFHYRVAHEHKSLSSAQRDQFIIVVCKYYSKVLALGSTYAVEAIHRLLSLWLNFDPSGDAKGTPRGSLGSLTKTVHASVEKLPAHVVSCRPRRFDTAEAWLQFLLAFSQIVSRICHGDRLVYEVLETIILKVLSEYPHQATWNLVSVLKSTYKTRASRCRELLHKAKASTQTLLTSYRIFADELLRLCNHQTLENARDQTLSMRQVFPQLLKLVPSPIIVPLQSSMTVTLPAKLTASMLPTARHIFPEDLPQIHGFKDRIDIMPSLQKPKRIVLLGSNGQEYAFLCKPKDDLRKDARLMEFNGIVNRLLLRNNDSRRRRLRVRTYAVVPLNEECGVIQWVNNTVGMRHVIIKLWKAKSISIQVSEIRPLLETKDPRPDKVFTSTLLPKYPPVLREWLMATFPVPNEWFDARQAFTRTLAVASMTGYVVGLGDRHGENILFDERTGECVHVDFNCLFEKGSTFEKPELVPFRLTQNLVSAFGVAGVEGSFRIACELSMGVLRDNKTTLGSIMEAFVYDPLVEWNRRRSTSAAATTGEVINEHAKKSLAAIEKKLDSHVQVGLPVSVAGQVDYLITEATSPANLCRMYIGWAPYM